MVDVDVGVGVASSSDLSFGSVTVVFCRRFQARYTMEFSLSSSSLSPPPPAAVEIFMYLYIYMCFIFIYLCACVLSSVVPVSTSPCAVVREHASPCRGPVSTFGGPIPRPPWRARTKKVLTYCDCCRIVLLLFLSTLFLVCSPPAPSPAPIPSSSSFSSFSFRFSFFFDTDAAVD